MSLKSGGLHEKHAVATWNLGTISVFASRQRKNYVIFYNSVRTSKRTPHFNITSIKCLMLFKEITAVYTDL
jgi:hypothetical protein